VRRGVRQAHALVWLAHMIGAVLTNIETLTGSRFALVGNATIAASGWARGGSCG